MSDALRDRLQHSLGTAYTLDRELAGGGMSRVFVADDVRLGRRVVIKTLSPELAEGVSLARFEREIAVAARLQHPNIVPVLAAGVTQPAPAEAGGVPYYTMPFVDGESLRHRMLAGRLPLAQAVSVLRDVARALAAAHAQGVVHRDVKPENVLLSRDAAVVTDFGIAAALSASKTIGAEPQRSTRLTGVGTSLGTPAYIAPEQAAGDAVSARADLYAWGVMAYELLAGRHPFADASTAQQLLMAHVATTPAALGTVTPGLPRPLAAIVMQCLAKEPSHRPASADELLAALDATTTGAADAPRRSALPLAVALVVVVLGAAAALWRARRAEAPNDERLSAVAVLPFENASGDTASNYFADGMTDELATALAKVPGIQVASRTSSYAFRKHEGLTASQIAARLGVGAIVEGAVRRAGAQLRITAQLTRASDGRGVWADAFTGNADSAFAVQERLTQAIVAAIAPRLAGSAPSANAAGAASAGSRDPVAYDLYLRGRYELNRRGDGVRKSIAFFRQALARDATFAPALAGLASAWALRGDYDAEAQPLVDLDSARAAARRAIALDSTDWEPYAAYGYALNAVGRVDTAVQMLTRSVALNPRSATARRWLSNTYQSSGRIDLAVREMRASVAADPLDAISASNLANLLGIIGDTAEALALARRAVALAPTNVGALGTVTLAYVDVGQYQAVLDLFRDGPPALRDDPMSSRARLASLAMLGHLDSVAAALPVLERAPHTPQQLATIAVAAAALGRWDRAFAAGDSAARTQRIPDWLVDFAPVWRPMASDARLRALCARAESSCDAVLARIAGQPVRSR